MLIEIYIEALLVDEELADLVWESWNDPQVGDQAGVYCLVNDRIGT